MKKIVLMVALLAVGFSASAALEDRFWNALFPLGGIDITDSTPAVPGVDTTIGGAVGWYAEVFNVTDAGHAFGGLADLNSAYSTIALDTSGGLPGVSPSLGYYGPGAGYIMATSQFGAATDLDNIQYVLYDNADKSLATYYIVSSSLQLPDAPDFGATFDDTAVTPVWTGATWQAIPEPATFLLFGIGGMGAWLLRRRQQA